MRQIITQKSISHSFPDIKEYRYFLMEIISIDRATDRIPGCHPLLFNPSPLFKTPPSLQDPPFSSRPFTSTAKKQNIINGLKVIQNAKSNYSHIILLCFSVGLSAVSTPTHQSMDKTYLYCLPLHPHPPLHPPS